MIGIRKTLKLGAVVFGLSALLLLVAPSFFLDLLQLDPASLALIWAMRMIGITLVALAGNMWLNSESSSEKRLIAVATVMAIAATGLGVLTILIPAQLSWFTYLYAAVGFLFGLNYLVCIIRRKF
jgi:MFS family permease